MQSFLYMQMNYFQQMFEIVEWEFVHMVARIGVIIGRFSNDYLVILT